MRIINNRTHDNHKSVLLDYFRTSDNIIIVSPFLSSRFTFFPFGKFKNIHKITLITTLKPNSFDQGNKVTFFKQLFEYGKSNSTDIEILIDNSLHAKLYISKKGGEYKQAVITSANFTVNGLRINNEWGVCIHGHTEIDKIVNDLRNNIVLEHVTEEKVKEFEKVLESKGAYDPGPADDVSLVGGLSVVNEEQGHYKQTIDLSKGLSLKQDPLNISKCKNYWLKPIGNSENIISWDSLFDKIIDKLHFSKNPSGVKRGDILFTYAVGHKNILSIYRVISGTKDTGNLKERYPYYVEGENLTPFYGGAWNKYDITISNQREYILNRKLFNITPSGLNSYGHLMYRGDKLRITKEFADYLVKKIVTINNGLSTIANMDRVIL